MTSKRSEDVCAEISACASCECRRPIFVMMSSVAVRQILLLLVLVPNVSAQEWRFYGGDPGGTRSSPLKQINRQNVKNLKRAWTYHMGEVDRGGNETDRHHIAPFESTPIVIDGMLYFSTPSNRVIALDAETGREIWQFDPQAGRTGPRQFFQHRGVTYWQSKTGGEGRILYGTFDGRLIALDARSGKPCPEFGKNGTVDLRAGVADAYPGAEYSVTSPPAVYHDLVITGAAVPEYPSKGPSGDVRAFDVRSGKLVWTFHTIPRQGEMGHERWDLCSSSTGLQGSRYFRWKNARFQRAMSRAKLRGPHNLFRSNLRLLFDSLSAKGTSAPSHRNPTVIVLNCFILSRATKCTRPMVAS